MSYQADAETVTREPAGTLRVSVSLSPSALPVHQACVPEGGVVYDVLVVLSGRFTLIAWSLPVTWYCAGFSVYVPLWPGSTSV